MISLFVIYILSMLVVGFAVACVLMGATHSTANTLTLRDLSVMALCSFIPVVNTFIAIFIISIVVWLLTFKPGSKHNPPS